MPFTKSEIHHAAMQRHGDWTEQLNDYCPASGLLMDSLITTMLDAGFDIDDLRHLETLSGPLILKALPANGRTLVHNVKTDVITYLRTWASLYATDLDTGDNPLKAEGQSVKHEHQLDEVNSL